MAMRVSGLNSGLDTESIVAELVSAYSIKTQKYEKEQTKISWKQEIWEDLNTKVNSLYKSVGNLRYNSGYSLYKTTSSDSTKASVSVSGTPVVGTQKLHVLSTAQSGYLTGGKLSLSDSSGKVTSATKMSALGFTDDSGTLHLTTKDKEGNEVAKDITITKNSTIGDVVNLLKEGGINASFDENNGRIFLSSTTTGVDGDFTLTSATAGSVDADGNPIEDSGSRLLGLLGLDTSANAYGESAVKIDGCDATIVLNGVVYSGASNEFAINGLNISVSGVTDDINDLYDDNGSLDLSKLNDNSAIMITTSTDTQGIYDTIKDFLTNYNNIINEITKLYNADSASDYEPLTDDEMAAMSDTQIEKWETKIKDSLLRRDSTLSTLMNSMMNSMAQTIEIDGKKYALSSFGIQTLGYLNAAENEQNAYHIYGDEDDENTASYEDKLMAAIISDPDTVIEFMKQLSTNLYNAIDDQMQSTELRTRYSIYNDKELATQYSNYTKIISDWEDKVSEKEDYYYSKFTSMEIALAKLQSQTSSLTGLLGG